MMEPKAILLPVFSLVGLTVSVWLWMYATRLHYMKTHRVSPQSVSDRVGAAEVLRAVAGPADNFRNLLEVPLLFYLLSVLVFVTGTVDLFYIVMAWFFVALRVAHSLIHVTYNRVMYRFTAYLAGCIVLWAMWCRFVIDVL